MAHDPPPSPRWLTLAACCVVVLGLDVPLEVNGSPVGFDLRALAAMGVAFSLWALRPEGPLRRTRRALVAAAGLSTLGAISLLLGGGVDTSFLPAIARPLAAGSLAGACYLGGAALARLGRHRAWSYATRACERAQLGGSLALLILFVGALGALFTRLILGQQAACDSYPSLSLLAGLLRAAAAGLVVRALAETARDQATLAGGAWTLLGRLGRRAGLAAGLLVSLWVVGLEGLRLREHLRRGSFAELRLGPPARWRPPAPPAGGESWTGTRYERGLVIPVSEPASSFADGSCSHRYRLEASLSRGEERLFHVEHSLLVSAAEGSLRGARVETRRALGSPDFRLVVHTWLGEEPDQLPAEIAPAAGARSGLPFVVWIALLRGGDLELGGRRTPSLRLSEVAPMELLRPARRPWRLRGYELVGAPRPRADLRYVLRAEGVLSLEPGEASLPMGLAWEASHDARSYQLLVEHEETSASARGRQKRWERRGRKRSVYWRGALW